LERGIVFERGLAPPLGFALPYSGEGWINPRDKQWMILGGRVGIDNKDFFYFTIS